MARTASLNATRRPDQHRPAGTVLPAAALDTFARRHIGPSAEDRADMLALLGAASLEELTDQTVPATIRLDRPLQLRGLPAAGEAPLGESQVLDRLAALAAKNKVMRSCIGMGYYDTLTPGVIQRNILENPGWYTQYTPYQAEISQGRLEALLNFQTMVADLTGLPLANGSLLDEATAAAEAMAMCHRVVGNRDAFVVADHCHPQTIAVMRTRAESLGIELRLAGFEQIETTAVAGDVCGVLVQYPTTEGTIIAPDRLRNVADKLHAAGALFVAATDLLALTLIVPPGEFGADIAVGSAQRFGVPMGFGGPHAAFMATSEKHARRMPGRIVGVSKDAHGKPAYRLAIQTREQHIKRDKATSNICTAQVLLAIMASMYAVYHGPQGLRRIAAKLHEDAVMARCFLHNLGYKVSDGLMFDTIRVLSGPRASGEIMRRACERGINLRDFGDGSIGIAFDETIELKDLWFLFEVFGGDDLDTDDFVHCMGFRPTDEAMSFGTATRQSSFLTHKVFNAYHAEHEMLRYIFRLQSKDISLAESMIPLGSCTMKLNGTALMAPVTWPGFAKLHPYAPAEQAAGYHEMFRQLEDWLAEITGFAATSLQPNAGSQGEYAGLLAIRAYHESRGDDDRKVCLIPVSAHGTNPASAVIAGFEVVPVACDDEGNIDVPDLEKKAKTQAKRLGALMITYPSTHGVFEEAVRDICRIIHEHGGQVYMDGANMNAQVGLCRPGDIGADVCHLNLHKTFCIPHGGGGPGMGPICVAEHLRAFLPGDPLEEVQSPKSKVQSQDADSVNQKSKIKNQKSVGPVSAAHYGSASILPISWVYIALMGPDGLRTATQTAILNANYMAKRLEHHYDVLFTGSNGRVAHEFVMDCRQFRVSAAVEVEDIAKRLMDYGFHAPTMSWPVAGTLMIEPTESESKAELDRFCDALISIREEIRAVEEARADLKDNPLKHAPHTAQAVAANVWPHAYPREQGAYPAPWLRQHKYWPPVARIDNPYGDRHLVCTCPPMDAVE